MQLHHLDAHRHVVRTRSGEVSYVDAGTGPVALFVHGIATNAYLWRNVIEALTPRYRCAALDLPLHGQTPVAAGQDLSVAGLASVLNDFCDALGLAEIHLVGGILDEFLGAVRSLVAEQAAAQPARPGQNGDGVPFRCSWKERLMTGYLCPEIGRGGSRDTFLSLTPAGAGADPGRR
jgi:hypothetical protein